MTEAEQNYVDISHLLQGMDWFREFNQSVRELTVAMAAAKVYKGKFEIVVKVGDQTFETSGGD